MPMSNIMYNITLIVALLVPIATDLPHFYRFSSHREKNRILTSRKESIRVTKQCQNHVICPPNTHPRAHTTSFEVGWAFKVPLIIGQNGSTHACPAVAHRHTRAHTDSMSPGLRSDSYFEAFDLIIDEYASLSTPITSVIHGFDDGYAVIRGGEMVCGRVRGGMVGDDERWIS